MKRKVERQGRDVGSDGSSGCRGQVTQKSLAYSLTDSHVNLGNGEEK